MEYSFRKESVLKILFLCVITVGVYLIYKLFQLSREINKHNNEISSKFILLTVILFGISLASLVWGAIKLPDTAILKSHLPVHFLSSVFDIIWIAKVRNKLNMLSGATKGQKRWLNAYFSSIFHVVYFQYVINRFYEQTINKSLQQKIC